MKRIKRARQPHERDDSAARNRESGRDEERPAESFGKFIQGHARASLEKVGSGEASLTEKIQSGHRHYKHE